MLTELLITDCIPVKDTTVVGVPKWDAATTTYTFNVYGGEPVLVAAKVTGTPGVNSAKIAGMCVRVIMDSIDFVNRRQELRDLLDANLPTPDKTRDLSPLTGVLASTHGNAAKIANYPPSVANNGIAERFVATEFDWCDVVQGYYPVTPPQFMLCASVETEPDTCAVDRAAIAADNMALLLTAPTIPQPRYTTGSLIYHNGILAYRVLSVEPLEHVPCVLVKLGKDVHILRTADLDAEIYMGEMTVTPGPTAVSDDEQAQMIAARTNPREYMAGIRARQFGAFVDYGAALLREAVTA